MLASSSREERPGAVVIAQLSFIEHTLSVLVLDTPVTLTPCGSPWLFCVPRERLPPGPCRGGSRTRHSPALDSNVQAHRHLCMSLPPSDPMGAVSIERGSCVSGKGLLGRANSKQRGLGCLAGLRNCRGKSGEHGFQGRQARTRAGIREMRSL